MSIDQYPLIPKAAFLYFPKEEEIYQFRKEKPYRFIFEGGVRYCSFEKQKLNELQVLIKKEKHCHHIAYMQESIFMRFLQATKYDLEDCIEALQKYKKWEDSIFPLTLKPTIQSFLKQGFLYLTGRDSKFRPIIVVDVGKMKEADLEEREFLDLMGFFFQYVVQNCFIEGQVETWVTIVDLAKMGLFSLGGIVMDTIKFLSNHFRCRLHHNYLVNCPGSMTFLFGMVKSALSQDQIAKITLGQEPFLPAEAFADIGKDQIEKKYGGSLSNRTTYWPLEVATSKAVFQTQNKLISVQQYGQMHENGLLGLKKICKPLLAQYEQLKKEKEKQRKQERREISEAYQIDLKISNESLRKQIDEPAWQDPPRIQSIPQLFSMQEIFASTSVQITSKRKGSTAK